LIKLKTPLKFTNEIQTIELPQAESEPTGIVYLYGWDLILSNEVNKRNELKHIKLHYIDRNVCNIFFKALKLGFSIVETSICAGPLARGTSDCNVRIEKERERKKDRNRDRKREKEKVANL